MGKRIALFLLILVACQHPRDGKDGQSCSITQDVSGTTITCPNQDPVVVKNGVDGQPGLDGTRIISVQFCSGYTTHYPSTFAEVGLCIDSSLYGVYFSPSQGTFLSLLPTGRYSSTSNVAPCDFTVEENCSVVP